MARLEYVNAIYKYTKLLSLHPLQSVVDFSTNYGLVDLFVVFSYMFEDKYPLLTKEGYTTMIGAMTKYLLSLQRLMQM